MRTTPLNPITGALSKLRAALATPVAYALRVGEASIDLNALLGRRITIAFSGRIHCVACGRAIRRSYGQGHCWPCFRRLASCDACIMSPERCHYDAGTCREPAWGRAHCMQPHVVYLANTSGLKVGITRATQVPTRWIDQGAAQAVPILGVATRRDSGLVEAALRAHVADRTDWRRMLRGVPPAIDLDAARARLLAAGAASHAVSARPIDNARPIAIDYPVLEYPAKVAALGPARTPRVEGTLLGVKGQYLILDRGVLNIRRHAGYEVTFGMRA